MVIIGISALWKAVVLNGDHRNGACDTLVWARTLELSRRYRYPKCDHKRRQDKDGRTLPYLLMPER